TFFWTNRRAVSFLLVAFLMRFCSRPGPGNRAVGDSRSCLPQHLNSPGFAIHLEQVSELVNASAIVYPGGFRFCRGNQPLLLPAFRRLTQPGIVHLSGFVEGLLHFLLGVFITLTGRSEPMQYLL